MKQYQDLMRHILETGHDREDRTGTGTLSVFGYQSRYDLSEGFPLVTTKKCNLRSIIHELLWFLSGDTNIKYLQDNNITIWDEWADGNGDLGRVYGAQWRSWKGPGVVVIDQIKRLIESLIFLPDSRRHIVSAWNPGELHQMALPPCHAFMQFYVQDSKLSCQLYQRSGDVFLGVPFNIASYALLTHMFAHVLDYKVGELIMNLGDTHIYSNHYDQVDLQLSRTPTRLPTLLITKETNNIFDIGFDDIKLVDYNPQAGIKAKVSV